MTDEPKVEPTPQPTPAPVVDKEVKVYPEDYVKTLRAEAAENRVKAKELEQQLAKLQANQDEIDTYKKGYEDYKKQVKELENSIRESLLEKIPEKLREKYKELDITTLKLISEDLSISIITTPGHESGTVNLSKSPLEMTQKDWEDMRVKNPDEYRRLLNELTKGK